MIGKNSWVVRVCQPAHENFDEQCLATTFKRGRTSVLIWGAVSYGFKLHIVLTEPGKRTAKIFVDILYEREMTSKASGTTRMEDGAPIHRVLLQEHGGNVTGFRS